MAAGAKLLVIERVLPEPPAEPPALSPSLAELNMMILTPGRERTQNWSISGCWRQQDSALLAGFLLGRHSRIQLSKQCDSVDRPRTALDGGRLSPHPPPTVLTVTLRGDGVMKRRLVVKIVLSAYLFLGLAPTIDAQPSRERAFTTMVADRPDLLLPCPTAMLFNNRDLLFGSVLRLRIPFTSFVVANLPHGVLFSYGPSFAAGYRSAAKYVDKILRGAKPVDLPIEEPTKFDLVVKLKTARTVGVTVPPSVLLRADQVIE